jgi:hypothetical protein
MPATFDGTTSIARCSMPAAFGACAGARRADNGSAPREEIVYLITSLPAGEAAPEALWRANRRDNAPRNIFPSPASSSKS